MSFTARDKKILALLGVLIASLLLWKTFLVPQIKSVLKLKNELNAGNSTYKSNMEYAVKIKGMDGELKILNQRLKELRAKYPPAMNCDEILVIVKNMAKASELYISSLSFNSINPAGEPGGPVVENSPGKGSGGVENINSENKTVEDKKIDEFLDESGLGGAAGENAAGEKNASVADGKGYELDVKIEASGSVEQIKSFLYRIENLKNKVSYKDLQISMGDKGVLNFNATVGFMGIADKNAGTYTMLESGEWAPLGAAGKPDIFNPYEGYAGAYGYEDSDNSNAAKGNVLDDLLTKNQKYDFTMRVVPYDNSIAIPTVSLLAENAAPNGSNPVLPMVYGDSEGEEKVDLYIEEKDGRFYCKFKTAHESFPDAAYNRLAEFIPAGKELKMLVDSTLRKSKNDNSTVRINITNNTKKALSVKVIGDDRQKPRVIIPKAADVQVAYD